MSKKDDLLKNCFLTWVSVLENGMSAGKNSKEEKSQ